MPRPPRFAPPRVALGLPLGLALVLTLPGGLALGRAGTAVPRASAASAASSRAAETAAAVVRDATGRVLGSVRFERYDLEKTRVSVSVRGLEPGFHGFHVHAAGVCDPRAVDRATGTAFSSAGSHLGPGTHGAGAGDMPPLLAADDGTASASFVTDRFTLEDLADTDGSAVVVHAGPDNFAHIPKRYFHRPDSMGATGPDLTTRKTGDAGARIGCGVVRPRA
ncbi:superoxide dismutase family protein [Microbispora cellulosiformans]|uniref:Superoxide dismutase [Cu-Zn] n=1 Tax=Microbispora cellulosiformans TaxID=2614688 RepID=A0A5J5K166_9ACTN|nr:superoxide dismutase family protein [Microbispora cellulosiformans]KAA9377073.1 superoxide dismutase family protein [Microbispora cellulosiformans]